MSELAQRLLQALQTPASVILLDGAQIAGSTLHARVQQLGDALLRSGQRCVASRLDNGADWLVLDLALRAIGAVHIPLPTFFSAEQIEHGLHSSGAQALITSLAADAPSFACGHGQCLPGVQARLWPLSPVAAAALPAGTACITYTSGSTGRPKGVCLSAASLQRVATSLMAAAQPITPRRHLCLMPLSTLLEHVAGVYAGLLSGAQIALPTLAEIGYSGASGLQLPRLLRCLQRYQPESVILAPQLLQALVAAAEQGARLPTSLRYLAVGGARVAPALLARAAALQLPVFEGYGLSECASVVCLNRPQAKRAGSVGQALPHVSVQLVDGEIVIEGERALGYLGADRLPDGPIRSGDLGHIDDEGFVHVTGRRSHVFITAYGRNVSPEWVESELTAHPAIAQAMVWGEAQADNIALLLPSAHGHSDGVLARAVAEVNRGLPDYARIGRFIRIEQCFSTQGGLLTANGRLRRQAILAHYQAQIDACYRRSAIASTGETA